MAVGALGPSLFRRDFAMGHMAWGVTFLFPTVQVSFFRVIRLIDFVTQLTTVLQAASPVSCHNFRSLCLCFNKWSRPGRLLCMSESVTLLVDSLYAKATEVLKSRAALSASTPDWILIWGDISSEARLWNRSQSVDF
jgi:hypothetical protein